MSSISYHCPNCGASLEFHPNDGGFVCDYCNSKFNRYDIENQSDYTKREANYKREYNSNVGEQVGEYFCSNCGAHIITSPTTVSTKCYYCQSAVIMKQALCSSLPIRIVPFKLDEEHAKLIFKKWISKKSFVPKEFKKNKCIKNIKGIYFPYWLADVDGDISYQGKMYKNIVQGLGKETIKFRAEYKIEKEGQIHMDDIMISALSTSQKKLIEGVQPFDESEMEPFTMTYLSGFQAEQKDIEVAQLEQEGVEKIFEKYAELKVQSSLEKVAEHEKTRFSFKRNQVTWEYSLMPVWILTHKYKGELYCFAMNGQNGRCCGRVPIDRKKLIKSMFLLAALILTIIIPISMMMGEGFGW